MKCRDVRFQRNKSKQSFENPNQRQITRKTRVFLQNKYKNSVEQKEMLLRVIGKEIGENFIVIIAYKTSKIEKYWK